LKSEETKEEEGKKKKKNRKERTVCLVVCQFVSLSLSGVALEVFRRLSEDAKGKMKCLECKENKGAIISLTRPNMCWRVVDLVYFCCVCLLAVRSQRWPFAVQLRSLLPVLFMFGCLLSAVGRTWKSTRYGV